jgi:capsular exopolysaccharide synthesis family protein
MLSVRYFGAVLWQRRVALVTIFLATYVALSALIISMPTRFVAESLVSLDNRPMRSVQGALSGQEQGGLLERVDGSVLSNEINILTSRRLLERVVATMRLEQDPEFVAKAGVMSRVKETVSGLMRRAGLADGDMAEESPEQRGDELLARIAGALTVEVPRGSSQISVRFRSTDPAKAATIVNTLVAEYLDEQRRSKDTAANVTLAGFEERVQSLRQRVQEADRAVQAFRDENRLLKTDGVSPVVQQFNELTLAEQRARTDAEDAAARLGLLRARGITSLEAVASMSESNQRLLGTLITQEADTRARLASSTQRLGSAHPEVLQLRAQAQEIAARLAAQRSVISATLESEATVLQRRHERLAAALRDVRERLQRENELEAGLEQLNSQARAARTAHDDFLVSYNRARALQQSAVADLRVLYEARRPGLPAMGKLPLLMVAALVSALVAVVGAALLHLRAASKRLTARQFEELYGIPVIGMTPIIPKQGPDRNAALYLGRNPLSEYAEAVRGIRNAIDFDRRKATSIAVVSAQAGEGKSTLAASLAMAWAAAGARTLVLDCDTRRSSMPELLGAERKDGLTKLLAGPTGSGTQVQRNERLGFDFIIAGAIGEGETTYRFTRETVGDLIAQFEGRYDKIILDLPPLLAVADAEVGAAASDLCIFVSHWGRTQPAATQAALDRLRRFGVLQVRGVFSQVDRRQYIRLGNVNRHLYRTYMGDPYEPDVTVARP